MSPPSDPSTSKDPPCDDPLPACASPDDGRNSNALPPAKRRKAPPGGADAASPRDAAPPADDGGACLRLLLGPLPPSLVSAPPPGRGRAGDDDEGGMAGLRALWDAHGFRTGAVASPRPAVSVYLDSCRAPPADGEGGERRREDGRAFLLACIGMAPRQASLERHYRSALREAYCLRLFLRRLRRVRREAVEDARVTAIVAPWEGALATAAAAVSQGSPPSRATMRELADGSRGVRARLLAALAAADRSLRAEQLRREHERIAAENCTLANACLQRWLGGGGAKPPRYDIHQVCFRPSPPGRHLPKYERITLYGKDPAAEPRAESLVLLPSLTRVLTARGDGNGAGATTGHPLDPVADDMVRFTWDRLLREGYYVDAARKERLGPELRKFYLGGLVCGRADGHLPVLLNAHFDPVHPLSLYLHGTAGAGKSSLVRALVPAVHATISAHCDPELALRFVKQNLNKPLATLRLELELRPNNNDCSVMSIIQGRRMALAQGKPGLVLVALEEVPSAVDGADPHQFEVGKLISMRFGGRKGEFRDEERKEAPRNATKRGISGDATIITIFTSNYKLEPSTLEALQRLEMFKNLTTIEVTPVAGEDRTAFALSYLEQRLAESAAPLLAGKEQKRSIRIQRLDIPCGKGDIRPLVRYLRMLSFYIHALVRSAESPKHFAKGDAVSVDIFVAFDTPTDITTITAKNDSGTPSAALKLKPGSFQNLYAVTPPKPLDQRATNAMSVLQKFHPQLQNLTELAQILEFYFAKTVLTPTVILSHDHSLIQTLMEILSQADNGVRCIRNINPCSYKMMKSLYDRSDTPNLRDDILRLLNQNEGAASAWRTTGVAVELICRTADAQLQIREIIEDTPSMTAFSTERSALHKDGLLFSVFVEGEITPEIASRASLII